MSIRTFSVVTLCASLVACRASTGTQDIMTVDELAGNIIDQLFIRGGALALQDAHYMDGTTTGKAGTAAVPSSRVSPLAAVRARPVSPSFPLRVRPVPTFVTHATNRMPRGTGVSERKGGGHQQEVQAGVWAPKAVREAKAEAPYSINWFVDGDMSHADGENPKAYMESKVEDALKFAEDKIEAVDVRLTVEGHKPKLYRFEVTVKGSKSWSVVVSKSKHAHETFPEAVDDMHDSLKRNLLKEKEKRISKVRHSDKMSESGLVASIPSDDEQSEDENDPGKEEEEFFTKDPVGP